MKESDFQDLLKSIDQARAIKAGKRKPSRVFSINPMTPQQIKEIRTKTFKVSQEKFALILCIEPATLKNWEQGRTRPVGPARALLQVASKKPEAVLEALHA